MKVDTNKRANCAALQLVIDAAKKHVEQIACDNGTHREESSVLDTAIWMMEQYVEKHKQR